MTDATESMIDAMYDRVSADKKAHQEAEHAPIDRAKAVLKPTTDFLRTVHTRLQSRDKTLSVMPGRACWVNQGEGVIFAHYELKFSQDLGQNLFFRIKGKEIVFNDDTEPYDAGDQTRLQEAVLNSIERALRSRRDPWKAV